MAEATARQIVLAARLRGRPQLTDFRLEETAIPTPSAGQVLLRVQYLSLDPYMRGRMDDRKSYAKPVPLGGVMQGESVATVIASQHPGYSESDIVLAQTGWRTHALSDRADLRKLDPAVAPVTTGLGVLGMPGFFVLRRLPHAGRLAGGAGGAVHAVRPARLVPRRVVRRGRLGAGPGHCPAEPALPGRRASGPWGALGPAGIPAAMLRAQGQSQYNSQHYNVGAVC